jgi:hypothetical protein
MVVRANHSHGSGPEYLAGLKSHDGAGWRTGWQLGQCHQQGGFRSAWLPAIIPAAAFGPDFECVVDHADRITDRKFDSACTCVGGPGVRGLGRGGACGTRLAPRVSPVCRLEHLFGPFRAFVEAKRPSLSQLGTILHPIPAQSRARFDNPMTTSVVPRQFGPPPSARCLLTTQGNSLSQLTIRPPFETRSEWGGAADHQI